MTREWFKKKAVSVGLTVEIGCRSKAEDSLGSYYYMGSSLPKNLPLQNNHDIGQLDESISIDCPPNTYVCGLGKVPGRRLSDQVLGIACCEYYESWRWACHAEFWWQNLEKCSEESCEYEITDRQDLEQQILDESEITLQTGNVNAEVSVVLESINRTFGKYIYKNIPTSNILIMATQSENYIQFQVDQCFKNQLKQLFVKCGQVTIKTIYIKCGRFPMKPWTK